MGFIVLTFFEKLLFCFKNDEEKRKAKRSFLNNRFSEKLKKDSF